MIFNKAVHYSAKSMEKLGKSIQNIEDYIKKSPKLSKAAKYASPFADYAAIGGGAYVYGKKKEKKDTELLKTMKQRKGVYDD